MSENATRTQPDNSETDQMVELWKWLCGSSGGLTSPYANETVLVAREEATINFSQLSSKVCRKNVTRWPRHSSPSNCHRPGRDRTPQCWRCQADGTSAPSRRPMTPLGRQAYLRRLLVSSNCLNVLGKVYNKDSTHYALETSVKKGMMLRQFQVAQQGARLN